MQQSYDSKRIDPAVVETKWSTPLTMSTMSPTKCKKAEAQEHSKRNLQCPTKTPTKPNF